MSLSSALNILNTSFLANAQQTAIISQNIANANTAGYTTKTANLAYNGFGGVDVSSITSAANSALLDQVNTSTSEAANQTALSTGLATLAQTVDDSATSSSASGTTQNGSSPSAMLANLQSALQTYASNPTSAPLGQAVVTAAKNLASSLNSGSSTVDQVRENADAQIGQDVAKVNTLLTKFAAADSSVTSDLSLGQDATNDEDTRNSLLTQISKYIGISTTTNTNGSMSIYTDSGVTLFQNVPSTITFTPSSTLTAGVDANAVMVNGIPITGSQAPMHIQSGEIAGLATLRDTAAPEYQAQLDQIAGGLINAFSETDQTGSGLPSLPGLFTFPGATALPTSATSTGLSGLIQVNPAVDPSIGGNVNLVRDGGINGASYVANSTNAAGFSATLQGDLSNLSATNTFDSSAGLGTSGTLTSYASDSVSWIQGQNQSASNAADYQNSILSQAQSALSSGTGVNMDAQMTNMLTLENTYSTTAKLLATANAMFTSLIAAV